MPISLRRPVLAVAGLLLASLFLPAAFARDNRVEALNQRMATAGRSTPRRWTTPMPATMAPGARADAALKQMEAVVSDCGRPGCDLQAILATYKRLLERPVADDMDDGDDDLDPVDVTGNGVPANANAGALLDAGNRSFVQNVQFNPRCRPASAAGSPTCARRCSPATRTSNT